MAETWNEASPAGSDNPTQGDDAIRSTRTAVRERGAIDHDWEATESPAFGDPGSTIGMHKKVTLVEQASDPTTGASQTGFYTKDVSGSPEIFFRDESDGTVTQITQGGCTLIRYEAIATLKDLTFGGTSSGDPVTIDDTQTLTNKTISGAISFSVYNAGATNYLTILPSTLGGNPTLTLNMDGGSRTLTISDDVSLDDWFDQSVKSTASPTFANATTTTATITDTVSERTADNGVTIDSLSVKDGKLNTNNSVVTLNITDAAITTAKLADSAITFKKIEEGSVPLGPAMPEDVTAATASAVSPSWAQFDSYGQWKIYIPDNAEEVTLVARIATSNASWWAGVRFSIDSLNSTGTTTYSTTYADLVQTLDVSSLSAAVYSLKIYGNTNNATATASMQGFHMRFTHN